MTNYRYHIISSSDHQYRVLKTIPNSSKTTKRAAFKSNSLILCLCYVAKRVLAGDEIVLHAKNGTIQEVQKW